MLFRQRVLSGCDVDDKQWFLFEHSFITDSEIDYFVCM